MTKKTKKRIIKYLVIPVSTLLILLLAGIAIVLNIVFTPAKLTPLATRLLNENLEARAQFDKIELTFFSSFPHFELHIKNGHLLQKEPAGPGRDTILSFASCDASFNIRKLVFKDILDVKEVVLTEPAIHVFIDKEGRSNLNILKADTATAVASDTDSGFHLKKIFIRNLAVERAAIDFTDESTGFLSHADNLDLKVKAADTPGKMKLKLESAIEKLNFAYDSIHYLRDLKTAMQAEIVFDKKTKHLVFTQSALKLNDVDFVVDGDLKGNKEQKTLDVAIEARLKVPSLSSLWQILPEELTMTKDVTVSGNANMVLTSKGVYGAGRLPVATIDLAIEKGAVAYHQFPGKISLLETSAKAYIDFIADKNSYIKVEKFKLEGTGVKANATASLKQPMSARVMNAVINADLDISKIKEIFPLPKGVSLAGKAGLAVEANGELKKIIAGNYNNLDVEGDITLQDIFLQAAADSVQLEIKEGIVSSHRDGMDKGMIKTKLAGLQAQYKNEHYIQLQQGEVGMRRGKLSGNQTPVAAKLSIGGLEYKSVAKELLAVEKLEARASLTSMDIKNLEARGTASFSQLQAKAEQDTIELAIQNGDFSFRRSVKDRMKAELQLAAIKAGYKTDHAVEIGLAKVSVGKGKGALQDARLKADATLQGMKYNNKAGDKVAAVNMVAHAFVTPGKTWSRPAAIISTFTADSLYALSGKNFVGIRKGSYDINLLHDSLNGWIPKGFIEFDNIMAYSPGIGMSLKLLQSKITFDDQKIGLRNTHIVFGKSDIYLSGFVSHLFPKDKQITRGKLKLKGKYIDANELMTAMHSGQEFYKETFTGTEEPELVAAALPDTGKAVFAIPANLDLELETTIDHVLFGTLDLKDIKGNLEVKEGHLDLKGFRLKTLAADLDTKLRYIPVDDKNARLIFALDISNIDMHNLHRLAPGMDTLLPMIKYFEGKAQFSVRGTGLLNEYMEVDARSVKGFAALKARDIMVLDNETFRDLAKTLLFKNREKNTVEVLDVEMLIENSRMEVLPAHIEIDRYQLAVGGLQNLDFTYDYHISVLKSPVPFKMGVDLKGDFDDYRISLAKAKYKFYFTDKKRLMEKADTNIINKKRFIQEKLNF